MPSLQRLYLDFNHIKVLDADSWLPVWDTIKYLDLMGNNVTCDCSLFWMTELNLPPRLYGECDSPMSLKGHTLSTLWPWHISEAPEMADQRCATIAGHFALN
ncbi:Immunoglobulin superfamily containing leucine-rich repeat protein-like protein [Leptotrombidium deliense]|uniref:Immunoglobulin superfamily containing leucine-rich repeat protein-like protein n=1 Tax=Leptotrombidium deliense TaxID=299467 RepID=A0A443RZ59_9ACAR|nr:Immunoglobulin superfamily containing leucine-rich repeat protein-like protein [Leptotrombidium deliense]